jgi:hypothetical protein
VNRDTKGKCDYSPFPINLVQYILNKVDLLETFTKQPPIEKDFVFEILKVFDWLNLWLSNRSYTNENPGETYLPPSSETTNTYDELDRLREDNSLRILSSKLRDSHEKWPGICPSSIWNLAVLDLNTTLEIVNYLEQEQSPFPRTHKIHTNCTEQRCIYAFDDTTKITQMHKCRDPTTCWTEDIPVSLLANKLNESKDWVSTAWDISSWDAEAPRRPGTRLISNFLPHETQCRYMAVSHVWLDGTGAGVTEHGTVNCCLMDYWVRIAKRLNCTGLWWDAICIPTEKEARRKALNIMLWNFWKAKEVLIHDNDLLNTAWTSGPDCSQKTAIALVLSTWFTRGWTAAEFYASRMHAQIALKNPNSAGPEPLLKCLSDINNWGPGRDERRALPTLAHLSAMAALARVYAMTTKLKLPQSLNDLLKILKYRSTAWEKDRLIIALLMAGYYKGYDVDPSLTGLEITKELMRNNHIQRDAIFHGEAPISIQGPWSWSPPSIFSLGDYSISLSANDRSLPPLTTDYSGILEGWFFVSPVLDQSEFLHTCGSHQAVVAKIHEALRDKTQCLWLRAGGFVPEVAPAILAVPVAVRRTFSQGQDLYKTLSCRYVGCVYTKLSRNKPLILSCSIGDDLDEEENPRRSIDARRIVSKLIEDKNTFENWADSSFSDGFQEGYPGEVIWK